MGVLAGIPRLCQTTLIKTDAMNLRLLFLTLLANFAPVSVANDWPLFRGPKGLGVAEGAVPPIGLGLPRHQLWKVAMPVGNSSPVVTGDKVFLTGAEGTQLVTLCLHRLDGRILWKRKAPIEPLKPWDPMTPGPATPTPVTDGSSVLVLFGAYGLIAYDLSGEERWRQPLARPDLEASASPILIGQSLIHEGIVTILDAAADKPAVLDQHKLGERATATPALVGNMILIRTAQTLHAFGTSREP